MLNLIPSLIERDRGLVVRFINSRAFGKALEIVISNIRMVKNHPEKYPEANLSDLDVLRAEIEYYMEQLDYDEF